MARYIDADSLYGRVKTHTNPYGKPTLDYKSGVKVLDMINQEPTADVVPKSEVERLQKENAELLLSETTELHLSMESLINVRVEHPIFKAIEGKVAWKIFDAFDKAIGSCEAWDHLPAVLLQLLAELKQKYSERSNDDNRTEHKETSKR